MFNFTKNINRSKNLILFVYFFVFQITVFSQSGTITNLLVSQRNDGSSLMDIYFDMAGTAPAYYITVEASFNGGTTFTPVPFSAISGDTGPITAGTGKHIIWNGFQSFSNTYSIQSKVKLIVTTTPPPLPCPGVPTVLYSGQTYNTVQIGTQCWLKENLNIGTMVPGSQNQVNNSIIEKYCYNNLESNCAIYGGLYQWHEMMQYLTTPGIQGICPSGWHVPTDAQWTAVTTFLGGTSVACGKMKTTGTIQAGTGLWNSPNTGATNESGFSAVPAGQRYAISGGLFMGIGDLDHFWSSIEFSTFSAWLQTTFSDNGEVGLYVGLKNHGISVRCLRDF